VQVDSIKTRVETAQVQRLKGQYDKLLWNFAFKFNFRHYTEGPMLRGGVLPEDASPDAQVREVQVDPIKARVESAICFSAWN
jgi:hypothetical protein